MEISPDPPWSAILRRRRAAPPAGQPSLQLCGNCAAPISGPASAARGRATAWYNHCKDCHEQSQARLELAEDRPGGVAIQAYRCLDCGGMRSCRVGWFTRCHVCLDERSNADWIEAVSQDLLAEFARDPLLALRVGRKLDLALSEPITARAMVQARSAHTVAAALRRFERSGWTVIATDVCGLPFMGVSSASSSHGTWGRHSACGSVALMQTGSMDCPECGPQPGSRTHQARKDDPYLLYLVTKRGRAKFGRGTEERVRDHQRCGATVVQVLRASFAEVVEAEDDIRRINAKDIEGRRTRNLPASFGQGTEVLRRGRMVSLTDVLPCGEDVTHLFRPTS